MNEPRLVSRMKVADQAHVMCGIGHVVRANVFDAVYRYPDMDGDLMAPFTMREYDPPTCVVCGLKLWSEKADAMARGLIGCQTPPLGCRIENP